MGEYDELAAEHANEHFYGKYRDRVIDVYDPDQAGRVRVVVPEVLGDADEWAVPSWPTGTSTEQHQLPEIGAEVWVEFEAGDRSRPIWDGLLN